MTGRSEWDVERAAGTAGELHERTHDFSGRLMRVNRVTRPAVVLSSTQSSDVLDTEYVQRLGLDVVRRSSGGGLVYLGMDDQVWIDYFLPRDDPLWVDDVGRSGDWLGNYWVDVLASIGIDGAAVAGGPWSDPDLGRLVCFAATGPGEVTIAGRKLVGVSQRRTRAGARFQCTVYRSFPTDVVLGLVDRDRVDADLHRRLVEGLGPGIGSLSDLVADPVGGPGEIDLLQRVVRAAVDRLPSS